jgi:hypothetical protein
LRSIIMKPDALRVASRLKPIRDLYRILCDWGQRQRNGYPCYFS